MKYKCPACSFSSTNYLSIARHMYAMKEDDLHGDAMDKLLEKKGLNIFEFMGRPGNLKHLAEILESEIKDV